MHHASLVRVFESQRGLTNKFASVGHRKLSYSADKLRHVDAIDVIHHQVMATMNFAGVARSNNVGVL